MPDQVRHDECFQGQRPLRIKVFCGAQPARGPFLQKSDPLLARSYLTHAQNLMRPQIPRHHQPGMAPRPVIPQLLMHPVRILPQIHIRRPCLHRRVILRARYRCVTVIRIFNQPARAAMGAGYAHQCRFGCAPAPFSSISRPSANRSSRYAAATSCGAPSAIRCAKQKPDAGVALNPP